MLEFYRRKYQVRKVWHNYSFSEYSIYTFVIIVDANELSEDLRDTNLNGEAVSTVLFYDLYSNILYP